MTQVTGKKIGLFGLSANPPHDGHVAMAKYAKDMLGLDEIWWVVAAQNPLKSKSELAPFEDRLEMAQIMAADHDWLRVTDIERREGVNRSFDMLNIMRDQNPEQRFVWIIGGDNLVKFDQWYKWKEIMDMIPIAVMARKGEMGAAIKSKAAKRAKPFAVTNPQKLADYTKGMIVLDNPLVPIQSTAIRRAFRQGQNKITGTHPDVIKRMRQKGLYL